MDVTLSKKMAEFTSRLVAPDNAYQQAAAERLESLDFPTTRDEYWKYTRLGKITNSAFEPGTKLSNSDISTFQTCDNIITIAQGEVRDELSSFNDLSIVVERSFPGQFGLNSVRNEEKATIFSTINDAYFREEVVITVPKNTILSAPLQILFLHEGEHIVNMPRLLINAEASSEAMIIITTGCQDENTQFSNNLIELDVAANAKLTVQNVQTGNDNHLSITTIDASQAVDSRLAINTYTLNGLLVRNNINIAVDGQNCETHMNGMLVTKGKQHVDNHTFVDHKVSNCFSNENYKYVLDGQSTGVFNGKVIVRPDAQVINAYQNNGNILLSDQATVDSKPELEIYADDVKCSHGSTTGQLDENALFYLQTRGISKKKAEKILVSAFIGEVMETIEDEATTAYVQNYLQKVHGWDADIEI
ncbi:MAG: Fe-S cluster assembly protein SufD [Crocinitomicaceae bacterium]